MYIKYSTRRFKIDHLNRIRALKKQYASHGVDRTQEQILVQVVEEGLKLVEQFIAKSDESFLYGESMGSSKRIAPLGIRDEESA